MKWVVLLGALSLHAAVTPAATEFKFDMGTAKSPVWHGCTRVTKEDVYTAKRGYGWRTKSKLNDCHRTPWHQKGSTTSVPDGLWGDFVFSYGENSFVVDLPNGEYEAVMLIGDMGSAYGPYGCKVRSLYPSRSIIVKANGKETVKEIITEKNILDYWYQNERTEYRRGDNPWTKYIETKLYPRKFPVTVAAGKLVLALSPDCRVAGIFIHPPNKGKLFSAWYRAQGPARRKAFLSRYDEIKNIPRYPPIVPTKEEMARGYLLFSRSYLEDVYPSSVPAPDEREVNFDIFAARGEKEPVTFSIKPLKELKAVRVVCSDLVGPEGARIPAMHWDVRHIRYLQIPNHTTLDRENRFRVEGRLMDRRETKDFEAGTTRRVWLTIRVPRNAAQGIYKGTIAFKPGNAPAVTFPVTLRVLPFELQEPKDVAIGIFYSPASPWRYYNGKEDLYDEDVRRSLKVLRDQGFTSVAYSIARPQVVIDKKTESLKVDMRPFDRFFKIFKESGMSMTAPFFMYGYDGGSNLLRVQPNYRMGWIHSNAEHAEKYLNAKWVRLFRKLLRYQVDYAKKRGWPPLVFCIHDEVHGWSQKKLDGMAKILQATYMQEPDVKTGGCINSPEGTCLVPFHDYPMYNTGVPFNEESLALVRKHRKTMTIDNFGQLRWNIGFWMWRIQPKVAADSFFCWVGGDPYNPFDDVTASELAVAYPGRKEWVPTPRLARMGEGIDDYKYAYTLQQTVRDAEQRGASMPLIARARETLNFLHDFVDVRLKRYYTNGTPAQEATDALRRRVARDIAALTGVNIPAPVEAKPDMKWWNARPRVRIPLRVDAGLYTHRDAFCVAEMDLGALGNKAGIKALDANGFRLVEANAQQTLVPFDVKEHAAPVGKDRLIWKASGLTPAMTSRWYYLYVGVGKKPRPKDLVLKARNVPNINLLENCGFEEVKPGTDMPVGWNIPSLSRLSKGHHLGATTDDKKSGRGSLKIVKMGKQDKKKGYATAVYPSFRVLPGRKYRLTGWIKRAEGSSYNEIMLHWLGRNKRNLGNRKFDTYTKGKHDWKYAERTGTAPQNAHYADIQVFIYPPSAEGVAYFDDIRLVLLPQGGHAPPDVSVSEPQTRP